MRSDGRPLRWAFAGGKSAGATVLRTLAAKGWRPDFVAVAETLPEAGREAMLDLCATLSVEAFLSRDLTEAPGRLDGLDLLMVCGFELLPASVFRRPRLGAVNIHPSLLPKYRGVHPISWALVNGESRTGVTLHEIDEGIDTGPILLRRIVKISDDDDIWSLTAACDEAGANLALRLLRHVAKTGALPPARKRRGRSSYARRRGPEDGAIDWSATSRDIFNLVRALQPPLPPAFTVSKDGKRIDVLHCEILEDGARGSGDGLVMKTGDGRVLIRTAQAVDGSWHPNVVGGRTFGGAD